MGTSPLYSEVPIEVAVIEGEDNNVGFHVVKEVKRKYLFLIPKGIQ